MRSLRLLAPAALCLGLASTFAAAQVVRGTVVDVSTGTPLSAATVSLLDASARVTAQGATDERGAFRLRAPDQGAYWIRFERAGYAATETRPFVLAREDSLELALAARASAAPLDPAAGRAARERNRNYATFLERQRFGRGLYRGPEEVVARPITRLPAAVAAMVATLPLEPGTGRPAMRARGCEPVVYLDGVRQGLESPGGAPVDMLQLVPPVMVRAIEVYADPSLVPNALWIGTNRCGAVALWTHDALGDAAPASVSPPSSGRAAGPSTLAAGRSADPRARSDLITRAELEGATSTNLYDVVRTLRPQWLRTRTTTFSSADRCAVALGAAERRDCQARMSGSGGIQVHLDGQRLTGLDDLRSLPLAGVAYLQFFNAADAGARWGLDHTNGAIYVSTDTR